MTGSRFSSCGRCSGRLLFRSRCDGQQNGGMRSGYGYRRRRLDWFNKHCRCVIGHDCYPLLCPLATRYTATNRSTHSRDNSSVRARLRQALNLTASRGASLSLSRSLNDVRGGSVRNVQVAWIFQVAACFQVRQVEANLQVRGVVPAAKVVRCDDMFWQRESRVAF